MEEKRKKKMMTFYITRENIQTLSKIILKNPYYTKSYLINEAIEDYLQKKFED